jgi:hypothetical protein
MAAKVAKFVLVWIAIPACLALLGYYVIGPRIGQVPPTQTSNPRESARQDGGGPDVVAHEDEVKPRKYAEPSVDVTVTKSTIQKSSGPSTRKRGTSPKRATRTQESEAVPQPPQQPTDDGGSGGAGLDGGA